MQRFHSASPLNGSDSERQAFATNQAVKPLPPLPRGWSRVCHETGLFLRGIGLGIVVTFFQGIFTKNFLEPEKVAIRRSRTTALLRTLIHAVPVGVAIFEIVLNLKGHFVGRTFDKQNYLQFAAKAHEIAMQASIATILLSYIRYQISAGKGMPFGAVLSGLQFLQVSYLWSVELWSSILSKDFHLRKKTSFAVLILICITVAATAGPSSASLLIARQDLWPLPSTYLAVNASVLDLWPDRLDEKKIDRECAVIGIDSLLDKPHCPISDNLFMLEEGFGRFELDVSHPDALYSVALGTTGTDFVRNIAYSLCNESPKDQVCATIPQMALLQGFYLTQQNNSEKSNLEGYQSMEKDYYQPYTIASCVTDVENASDQSLLRFARISETDSELNKDREIIPVPGLTKGQIIDNMSGDNSDFRVDWVDLPRDIFNTGMPGAVIVNFQNPNGSSHNITTCTLNAGWGTSSLVSHSQEPESIFSHMSNIHLSWPGTEAYIDANGYMFEIVPDFANISGFSYPQRHISVSRNWMEFLNPTIILPDNSTGNFISLMLSSRRTQSTEAFQSTETYMAVLLNFLLGTALADTGRGCDWEVFSDLKNATKTCDTCLVFKIEYSILGWLYSARGTAIRLALTVMLAYCLLVFGHIIYSTISGVSSTAWDSTAELVALAMNSSPTEILQNTCAGIIGRKAFKTPVRIFATTPGHLELVFGTIRNAQASELVMNKKYGKVTVKKTTKTKSRGSMRRVRYGKGQLLGARSKGRLRERSGSNAQPSLRQRPVAQVPE